MRRKLLLNTVLQVSYSLQNQIHGKETFHFKQRQYQTNFSNKFFNSVSDEGKEIHFMLPTEVVVGVEYNINIYSEVWLNNSWYESNPLHCKLKKLINEHVAERDSDAGEDTRGGALQVRQVHLLCKIYLLYH